MPIAFLGFATTDLDAAINAFVEHTGAKPTVIVVRPGFEISKRCAFAIESRFGIAGAMLLTDEISMTGLQDEYAEKELPKEISGRADSVTITMHRAKQKKRGRPKLDKPRCPHCQQIIRNFEKLGYWHGWNEGTFPPYWDELSAYVFDRDDYRCQRCQKTHSPNELVAHHVISKEVGGTDSARNLSTFCRPCHEIEHAQEYR